MASYEKNFRNPIRAYLVLLPVPYNITGPHKDFVRFHGHLCVQKRSRALVLLTIPNFQTHWLGVCYYGALLLYGGGYAEAQ